VVSGPDGDLLGYVSALVEAGVPLNAGNREHDAALHIAARQGHVQVRGRHRCSISISFLMQQQQRLVAHTWSSDTGSG
jgi:hypothetical protein